MINQVPRLVRHNTGSVEHESYFQGDLFEKYHPSGARVAQCTTQRHNWVGITTFSISLHTLCVWMLACMCVCALCAFINSVLMQRFWDTRTRRQKTTQIIIFCRVGLYNSVPIATRNNNMIIPYSRHGNTIFKVMLLPQ